MYKRDYTGDFDYWQSKLDAAGIDYDVRNLAGASCEEINREVNNMVACAEHERLEEIA